MYDTGTVRSTVAALIGLGHRRTNWPSLTKVCMDILRMQACAHAYLTNHAWTRKYGRIRQQGL